jgi:carbon storage regulator
VDGVCFDNRSGALLSLRCSEVAEMLVLSRKKNESIIIDEKIVITVIEVRGDKVRLGIQAPREIPIHRSEVYEALARLTEQDSSEDETSIPNETT